MSEDDRLRWDARYARRPPPDATAIALPEVFTPWAAEFPTTGTALDVACGQGGAAVWLAQRGLRVTGVDVSPVAIQRAGVLAGAAGVAQHCRFEVADVDDGLPAGPFEVVVCHLFREPALDAALVRRLAPGGLLAIAALRSGRFGASAGELAVAFAALDPVGSGAADGIVWLLGRRSRIGAQ